MKGRNRAITLKNRNLADQFIQEATFTPSGVVRIAKLRGRALPTSSPEARFGKVGCAGSLDEASLRVGLGSSENSADLAAGPGPGRQRSQPNPAKSSQIQLTGAPASNQRLIRVRSASLIWVALFSGISLSTTTCW
jgi:hypothetical protein